MSIGGKGKLKRLGGPRKTKKNSNDNSRPAKLYIPYICMEYLCTYIYHRFEATVGCMFHYMGAFGYRHLSLLKKNIGHSIYSIFIPELSGTGVVPPFFQNLDDLRAFFL